jgi:hypothetical protein
MPVDDPRLVLVILIIITLIPLPIPLAISSSHSTLALPPRLDLAIRPDPREMKPGCVEKVAQACWSIGDEREDLGEQG